MATNYGKTHYEEFEVPAILNPFDDRVLMPARTYMRQHAEDGRPWKDVAAPQKGSWFIAVNDEGYIMCCERDPTMVAVVGVDIWQIEHPGPREAIFCQKWDGEKVVPYEVTT